MKNKPTKYSKGWHQSLMMTKKQAERTRRNPNGIAESKPSDYDYPDTAERTRMRVSRHGVEDIKLAKELGITLAELKEM